MPEIAFMCHCAQTPGWLILSHRSTMLSVFWKKFFGGCLCVSFEIIAIFFFQVLVFFSIMSNLLLTSSSIFLTLEVIQCIFISRNSSCMWKFFCTNFIISTISVSVSDIWTQPCPLPTLGHILVLLCLTGNFWLNSTHQDFHIVEFWILLYSFKKRLDFLLYSVVVTCSSFQSFGSTHKILL